MARAAVRAKQAQAAQAQAAAKPRRDRKHASGGNPNQDLFFSRLRRKQKWVFFSLAIVFAVSFTALGVGSGSGDFLQKMFNGILGNGSNPVAAAQKEIKAGNTKGYLDLANAYVKQGDQTSEISALEQYLRIKKTDSAAWTQLGYAKQTEGDRYTNDYQQIQQAGQYESPGSLFAPTGDLAGKLGNNPVDDYYQQQNNALMSPLYQRASTDYTDSLAAFKQAAKYAKGASLPGALLALVNAAQRAGKTPVAIAALERYIKVDPNAVNIKAVKQACKNLGGCGVSKHKKTKTKTY